MRIAVIGARQARGGIGGHLARFCVQAGAQVVALYGTSEQTAREAVASLGASTGLRAQAVWSADALDDVGLDGLVIASPDETHEAWLERALARDLHVLCEKPLVWGGDAHPDARALALAERFRAQGLLLRVNAQWPLTLPAYEKLFPGVAVDAKGLFMRLSPTVAGSQMFRVSLSHPLSLLATVLPDADATVEDATATLAPGGAEGRMEFAYCGAGRRVRATVHLVHQPEAPREAAYGFDEHVAYREVVGPDYKLELQGDGRRVPLPDPTPLLVRSFLEDAASMHPRRIDPAVLPGMRHLVQLMAAVPDEDGRPS
jgi:NAD(P)-dependent dehydrogenase (short-subunit alcohol dehydrogenase family)